MDTNRTVPCSYSWNLKFQYIVRYTFPFTSGINLAKEHIISLLPGAEVEIMFRSRFSSGNLSFPGLFIILFCTGRGFHRWLAADQIIRERVSDSSFEMVASICAICPAQIKIEHKLRLLKKILVSSRTRKELVFIRALYLKLYFYY